MQGQRMNMCYKEVIVGIFCVPGNLISGAQSGPRTNATAKICRLVFASKKKHHKFIFIAEPAERRLVSEEYFKISMVAQHVRMYVEETTLKGKVIVERHARCF